MAGLDGPDLTGQALTWDTGHTGHRVEVVRHAQAPRRWLVECLDCPGPVRWPVHESVLLPMLERQGL